MPGMRIETPALGRRTFLSLTSAAAVTALSGEALLEAVAAEAAANPLDEAPFTLGVASGNPDHSSVILWTRLAPAPLQPDGGMPSQDVTVTWEIARDEKFKQGYATGTVTARAASAHAVHVEARNLRPDSWHWYRFTTTLDGRTVTSRTGRTRTLPAPGHRPDRLRFAFASCQAWTGGAYPAWRDLAQQDLDFVIHLGDYIYETRLGSLEEFRRLHSLYKTSPDLREAHARFPFFTTWDDHEVQNNHAADQPDSAGDGRPFLERRANAYQAYYEHLPLAPTSIPEGPDLMLYRRFDVGRLARFSILDTRQYRSDQPCGDGRRVACDDAFADSQTMTGPEQEAWLLEGLSSSKTTWNVIPQQTIMARFDYDLGPDLVVNLDQWDGYAAARQRILGHLQRERVTNPVVLSGDWHTAWVNDLLVDFDDPSSPVVATEFVGTSISSGAGWDKDVRVALEANPHVQFYNGSYRGYTWCEVTPETWRSTYRVILDARDAASPAFTMGVWEVRNGVPGAQLVDPGDGVSGTVRSTTGAPINLVEVIVRDAAGEEVTNTLTDPQGRYTVFLPAGTYTVEAWAVGHQDARRTLVVTDRPTPADLTLAPLRTARAGTGRLVPGPRREATTEDIVLENSVVALALSNGTEEGQLRPVTRGKPLDMASAGHLDQIDWINMPYAHASEPTGTGAWQSLSVRSDAVTVAPAPAGSARVRATGVVRAHSQVTVTTDYTLAEGSRDIDVLSTFRNTGASPITLWIGDAMDHDGAGQRSGVAGIGTVDTPYGTPAQFTPTGDWIGMTGTDGQLYGIKYADGGWDAYGNGNWIMSRQRVTISAGGSVELRRVLTSRTQTGALWSALDA